MEYLDEKEGEVIMVKFGMNNSPMAVQLTKHIGNLLQTYPTQRKEVIAEFKRVLESPGYWSLNFRIGQIINHYGVNECRDWFTLVYGWDFNEDDVETKLA